MRIIGYCTALLLSIPLLLRAQDTTIIQTLTYDSTARAGVWTFPDDSSKTYEKVLLQYSMRCHDGLVGNGAVGCREWDYHCNTVITDSSRTDSLQRTNPSHTISNFSGNQFQASFGPTYTYYDWTQFDVQYNAVLSETLTTVGTGSVASIEPFNAGIPQTKTQYLWTASELTAAGLTAGDITSLRLNLSGLGSALDYLRIGIKATAQSNLDPLTPETDGFTEVYFLNTSFAATGNQAFQFYNPFNWDGTSNLLVEFSYHNGGVGTNNQVQGMGMPNRGLQSSKAEQVLFVPGAGGMDLPTNSLSSVTNQVTISFWAYGEDNLPINTAAFEGKDNANRRQLNVHLPWGNGSIFWDCGNDGTGVDRISYAANPNDFKGRWTHWAFTKNTATGEMEIFADGHLVHSGTGNVRPIDVEEFRFGASNRGGSKYSGKLDELRIWNVALDSTTLQNWMYRDLTPAHPNYSNLVGYYPLDAGTGSTALDASPNAAHATILSGTNWRPLAVTDYWRNFTPLTERPNATFVKGTYTQVINTVVVRDSILNATHAIEEFEVVGTDLQSAGTNLYYPGGYQYVYDGMGMLVDSVLAPIDSTIDITTLTYYEKQPARYEILSFITPYGNGLDLGPDGVMWTLDVTDYLPILKGNRRLSIEGVGLNQEELDLRFLFIEGTPPRDVLDVQQIWPIMRANQIWYSNSFSNIINDVVFEPRTIRLNPNAQLYKIRSAITGHGQNGEFIPRWHFMNINGGAQEFRWRAWKECADMPVYPQGGTWLYDRAGWCPGVPTDVEEMPLEGIASPGDSITVDYGMDAVSNTADADYRVANQLVTYGGINHALDAALVEVIRPSNRVEFARFNPACTEPSVLIRNTGSTALTSLTITYQVRGGATRTYNWTGNLAFLEEEEVVLPVDNPVFWQTTASESIFEASVSAPNGGLDEYAFNDSYASEFEAWDSYTGDLSIRWRTNNKPSETKWQVLDDGGNIVLQNSPFISSNTIYIEEFNLPAGCYTLRFTDAGDDGLYYWALSSQGTGFVQFRELGSVQQIFEPEFGKFFQYDFWTDGIVGDVEIEHPEYMQVYPNPTEEQFVLEMQGWANKEMSAEIYDVMGKKVLGKTIKIDNGVYREAFSLKGLGTGSYYLRIYDGEKVYVKRVTKQ